MASREEVGSWLEGAPAGSNGYRGQRLGLPEHGPGSFAPMGRRIGALALDWLIASVVSFAFFNYDPMATLAVFAVETFLLVSTLGYTIGHRVFSLRVRPDVDGVPMVGFFRGAVRTVLLCLVIPAVIWDGDGRGMHDRAARTVIVRL